MQHCFYAVMTILLHESLAVPSSTFSVIKLLAPGACLPCIDAIGTVHQVGLLANPVRGNTLAQGVRQCFKTTNTGKGGRICTSSKAYKMFLNSTQPVLAQLPAVLSELFNSRLLQSLYVWYAAAC